ncbi:hypothetical protein GGR57DRAFT_510046, partial [Xylariaceae sp. FL1272]
NADPQSCCRYCHVCLNPTRAPTHCSSCGHRLCRKCCKCELSNESQQHRASCSQLPIPSIRGPQYVSSKSNLGSRWPPEREVGVTSSLSQTRSKHYADRRGFKTSNIPVGSSSQASKISDKVNSESQSRFHEAPEHNSHFPAVRSRVSEENGRQKMETDYHHQEYSQPYVEGHGHGEPSAEQEREDRRAKIDHLQHQNRGSLRKTQEHPQVKTSSGMQSVGNSHSKQERPDPVTWSVKKTPFLFQDRPVKAPATNESTLGQSYQPTLREPNCEDECDDPMCRATHAGHFPFRHCVSCSKHRLLTGGQMNEVSRPPSSGSFNEPSPESQRPSNPEPLSDRDQSDHRHHSTESHSLRHIRSHLSSAIGQDVEDFMEERKSKRDGLASSGRSVTSSLHIESPINTRFVRRVDRLQHDEHTISPGHPKRSHHSKHHDVSVTEVRSVSPDHHPPHIGEDEVTHDMEHFVSSETVVVDEQRGTADESTTAHTAEPGTPQEPQEVHRKEKSSTIHEQEVQPKNEQPRDRGQDSLTNQRRKWHDQTETQSEPQTVHPHHGQRYEPQHGPQKDDSRTWSSHEHSFRTQRGAQNYLAETQVKPQHMDVKQPEIRTERRETHRERIKSHDGQRETYHEHPESHIESRKANSHPSGYPEETEHSDGQQPETGFQESQSRREKEITHDEYSETPHGVKKAYNDRSENTEEPVVEHIHTEHTGRMTNTYEHQEPDHDERGASEGLPQTHGNMEQNGQILNIPKLRVSSPPSWLTNPTKQAGDARSRLHHVNSDDHEVHDQRDEHLVDNDLHHRTDPVGARSESTNHDAGARRRSSYSRYLAGTDQEMSRASAPSPPTALRVTQHQDTQAWSDISHDHHDDEQRHYVASSPPPVVHASDQSYIHSLSDPARHLHLKSRSPVIVNS